MIHPTATVEDGAELGRDVAVWHYAHVRSGAVIGDGTSLGKSCYVGPGVRIGERCKIQNGISIYRGISLGDDVLLGPHCVFTNDPYPRADNPDWDVREYTVICNHASVGAGAVVRCGVEIAPYSMIGAGAVLTGNTLPFGEYVGNPARLRRFVCRCGRTMPQYYPDHEPTCLECGRRLHITVEVSQ